MRVFIEFDGPSQATRALTRLTSLGYVNPETYGPFPLTDEQANAGHGSMPLALLAFGGGLVALLVAYLVQWWANVASYPLNIGGRPPHAAPAFIPATFESICLAATGAVFFGFRAISRMPRLWQPIFDIEGFDRTAIDRFWIEVRIDDSPTAIDRVVADTRPLEPLRIVVGEEERG
jgi:hypothetical protein